MVCYMDYLTKDDCISDRSLLQNEISEIDACGRSVVFVQDYDLGVLSFTEGNDGSSQFVVCCIFSTNLNLVRE